MLYSDRVRASEQLGLTMMYRDAQGVIRWKSNGLVVPPDVARTASFYPPEAVTDIVPLPFRK